MAAGAQTAFVAGTGIMEAAVIPGRLRICRLVRHAQAGRRALACVGIHMGRPFLVTACAVRLTEHAQVKGCSAYNKGYRDDLLFQGSEGFPVSVFRVTKA